MSRLQASAVVDLSGGRVLDGAEFAAHCAASDVLAHKQDLPAVLGHVDDRGVALITKIWRRDRGPLSALKAYHRRFRLTLARLEALGVAAPRYRGHGRVRGSGERYVVYERLPGEALRGRLDAARVERLAGFVATLHERGIYFRGLHLGNVIELPDGRLGLIDVQDLRIRRRPLSWRLRRRNLGILCAHPGDRGELGAGPWRTLVEVYCQTAGLSDADSARLQDGMAEEIRRRGARRAARRRRRGLPPLPD